MNWAAVYYRDATTRVALTEAHIAPRRTSPPEPPSTRRPHERF